MSLCGFLAFRSSCLRLDHFCETLSHQTCNKLRRVKCVSSLASQDKKLSFIEIYSRNTMFKRVVMKSILYLGFMIQGSKFAQAITLSAVN